MKILFHANRFPYPPYRGDKLKIYNLARELSQRHELHLLTFLEDPSDRRHLAELQKYFKKIILVPLPKRQSYTKMLRSVTTDLPYQVAYFASAQMHGTIDRLLAVDNYDAVHVQHLRLAQYWDHRTDQIRILDLPDAYSLYWKRKVEKLKGLKKWGAELERKRVYSYEKILNSFNLTLVCSKEDKEYLVRERQIQNIEVLPNGVHCHAFDGYQKDYSSAASILFTGNMDYTPNVDAVGYFVAEIWPKIQAALPKLKFIIAGQRPVQKVKELSSRHISVTGFVPDLSQLYTDAAVVVAPLRFGAGTQNKVLEAMASSTAVVSHEVGYAGLNISPSEGVICTTSAEAFAEATIGLLNSQKLRREMGEAGRAAVLRQFDWKAVAQKLEQYILQLKENAK